MSLLFPVSDLCHGFTIWKNDEWMKIKRLVNLTEWRWPKVVVEHDQKNFTPTNLKFEATSTKPVPEGTEIPLHIINSTHYNQDKANHIHKKIKK